MVLLNANLLLFTASQFGMRKVLLLLCIIEFILLSLHLSIKACQHIIMA